MDVTVENWPAFRVAYAREHGPYLESTGKAWERLGTWLPDSGLIVAESLFLGAMHDDPENTAPEKLRYDACVTLSAGQVFEGDEAKGIAVQVIPGGDYALVRHKGPYEGLGEAWGKLMTEWLPSSGREPDMRPCFEVYVNDPRTTPAEELLTDIYMPLKAKA